jgi:REP element-mobilizing transposase RayT
MIVDIFTDLLRGASSDCSVKTLYCFMPEHVHAIVMGTNENSDALHSMELFKQTSGWWLKTNRSDVKWQKSFHDRIVRSTEELAALSRYLVNNPVRRGLVKNWRDYPFTGAIGIVLEEFLTDLMPF